MRKRIGRTLPPAAAPLRLADIVSGVAGLFAGGERVKKFEEELTSFYSVNYSCAVSSGKAALVLILQALHDIHPERDEVLIPAYTCYSVPSAIIRAGFTVRLCDLAPGTLDFDFDRIVPELENPRLLCVIPTHLYGMPADVERINLLINGRDIFVLEDAAQAMGAEWNGRKAGTQSDVGLFSLGRGKAFSTVEGGIILTDNELIGQVLEKRLATLPEYGTFDILKLILNALALLILINPWIYWLPKSVPFLKIGETHFNPLFHIRRLSAFQAGMTKKWEKAIKQLNAARSKNAHTIAEYGIRPPGGHRGVLANLLRFPVLAADAETKRAILHKSETKGLGIASGYPDSIDGIAALWGLSDQSVFPVAKNISERIVTLPVHPFVSREDIAEMMHMFK